MFSDELIGNYQKNSIFRVTVLPHAHESIVDQTSNLYLTTIDLIHGVRFATLSFVQPEMLLLYLYMLYVLYLFPL
jgi:hypothetical protein